MDKKRNIKKLTITLRQKYNNPTYDNLLGKFNLEIGVPKEISVNHFHYSEIMRFKGTFKFETIG